ncbi:arginase [Lentzea sp. NBRC 105346]|uniref:arginase family protein n=1 Tax=Lentzea sp. NBRC 105346 TaxID=3032205 RepID=UPI0024A55F13|nr:arginase family protein [Lentzea sp. NBRC 105346]GLZ32734.1 arginase [Lentzea sp. NBRC 105346]
MEIHAVPQHQGAASSGPDSGQALALLAGADRWIDVPPTRSSAVDGILCRDELLAVRRAQEKALAEARGPVLTIGGDCGVELAPLAFARRRFGHKLAVAWFDAHGDLNTPSTSPSGAFHGMVLAAAMGLGDPSFVLSPRVSRVALIGARSFDPFERRQIWEGRVRHVTPAAARLAGVVSSCVLETEAEAVYLHVDLDVLDPSSFDGARFRSPGGMSIESVVSAIGEISRVVPIVGAGITECVTDDQASLRRLVPLLEAVRAGMRALS